MECEEEISYFPIMVKAKTPNSMPSLDRPLTLRQFPGKSTRSGLGLCPPVHKIMEIKKIVATPISKAAAPRAVHYLPV